MGTNAANKTVHGPPVQSRVAAANRAVLAVCATILVHMVMNRGGGEGCRTEQGQQAWKGKKGRCSKQPADEVAGTGLAVNSRQTKWPAQAL